MKICDNIIGFAQYEKAEWEGRGFGRRFIITHVCSKCGATRRRINSAWRGNKPDLKMPGGFICGALMRETSKKKLDRLNARPFLAQGKLKKLQKP